MLWINLFSTSDLFGILDDLAKSVDEILSPSRISLLNDIISAVKTNVDSTSDIEVRPGQSLAILLSLRKMHQDHADLDDLIALAVADSLPLYSSRTLLDLVIQHHMKGPEATKLATSSLSRTQLKVCATQSPRTFHQTKRSLHL